ncbi:MAG TPA: hypothetical protein VK770_04280 [Candidatus Acidoferrum sp.]|jgi:hypothetical protein|nr:hypothetical protein [Candidatus Acidoferrum sp.]
MITTPASQLQTEDRATLALGMALCALFLELAINVDEGQYVPIALLWLTIALIVCFTAVVLRFRQNVQDFLVQRFAGILVVVVVVAACIVLFQSIKDITICLSVFVLVAVGLLQAADLGAWALPLLVLTVVGFCVVSALTFVSPQRQRDPHIDVFLFQQSSAEALLHGGNPYTTHIQNIYSYNSRAVFQNPLRYGPGTTAYGPGVVGDDGWLTYGFPYPPLSLLMVLPAYLLGGDCRFASVIAIGLSALLMAAARPGRWGALIGLLFIINPQGFFVIDMSWTEPLLVFTFSLVMFCACRWRKGLPWALGLFFATKQYTAVALPLLFLLTEGPNPWKQWWKTVAKAALVMAMIDLPFIAWNPREFLRAVVQLQFVQPFRTDSLSYLVWLYRHAGGYKAPILVPFLIVVPVIVLALRHCAHTPAGFAAAVTLTYVTFFAFNKQAFCNYYYFAIGAACWAVAAIWPQPAAGSSAGSGAYAAAAHAPLLSGL